MPPFPRVVVKILTPVVNVVGLLHTILVVGGTVISDRALACCRDSRLKQVRALILLFYNLKWTGVGSVVGHMLTTLLWMVNRFGFLTRVYCLHFVVARVVGRLVIGSWVLVASLKACLSRALGGTAHRTVVLV